MGSQPESKLSRNIIAHLRAHGYFAAKMHGGPTMMAGLPDILVCAEGVFVGLETKMPGKRTNTSARQDYVHEEIRTAGGYCSVVCSPMEALEVVLLAVENHKGSR